MRGQGKHREPPAQGSTECSQDQKFGQGCSYTCTMYVPFQIHLWTLFVIPNFPIPICNSNGRCSSSLYIKKKNHRHMGQQKDKLDHHMIKIHLSHLVQFISCSNNYNLLYAIFSFYKVIKV